MTCPDRSTCKRPDQTQLGHVAPASQTRVSPTRARPLSPFGRVLRLAQRLACTVATVVACHNVAAAADAPDLGAVSEIAPGVFVHIGRIAQIDADNRGDTANWGFVVGERCVAVIDSGGSVDTGRALLAAVQAQTDKPICALVATHVHPDHTLGLQAFDALQPPPTTHAHKRLPAALAARKSTYETLVRRQLGETAPARIVVPQDLVEGSTQLNLGGRVLTLTAWATAHTDHDLTVYDAKTRTLFAGDLLFVQHIPVVDGRLLGWLKQLPQLQAIDAARVVPGHGPVTDTTGWQPQQAYLEALRDGVQAALAAGRNLAATVESLPATPGWQLVEQYHRRNVTSAYAELEWAD